MQAIVKIFKIENNIGFNILKNMMNFKFKEVILEIQNHNLDKALILLNGIEIDDKDLDIKNNLLGSIYLRKKEWSQSIKFYKKIIDSKNSNEKILNNIGVAYFNLGQVKKSIEYFNLGKKKKPNDFLSYRNLGISYKYLGDYQSAINNILQALKLKKDNLTQQLLVEILNYYNPKNDFNNEFLKTNKKVFQLTKKFNLSCNIEIEPLKKFLESSNDLINNLEIEFKETQIFRRNEINLNCDRHFKIFYQSKIIPNYCFSCYKVQINLKNVVDLIRVFLLFNELKLSNNNERKCIVEKRTNVKENYKGYIFCTGLEDAKKVLEITKSNLKKNNIKSKKIEIKHGCTEYYDLHPDYKLINFKGNQKMNYNEDWKIIEKEFDEKFFFNNRDTKIVGPSINKINLSDILIIRNWIIYAKIIGDTSYKKILDTDLQINFLGKVLENQIKFRKQN